MIVSIAIAVLPVPRSPMISSRWPRPIGIIESIALIPVCNGSFTGCRLMMPGATISTLRLFEHAGRAADFVALPQLEVVAENHGADVVFLEVQREPGDLLAGPRDREFEHFARHGGREPVDPGDAVLHLEDGADFADIDVRQVSRLDFLEEEVLQLAGT